MNPSLKTLVNAMTALAAVVLLVLLVFESGMLPGLPAIPSGNLAALFAFLFIPKIITHSEQRAAAPWAGPACLICTVLAVITLVLTVLAL